MASPESGVREKFEWNGPKEFKVINWREWESETDYGMKENPTITINGDQIAYKLCGEVQTTYKNEHDSFFDIDVNYEGTTLCPQEDPLSAGERELVEGL